MAIVKKTTKLKQNAWLESSAREIELAQNIARIMLDKSRDFVFLCQVMEGLALRIISSEATQKSPLSDIVNTLWDKFLDLGHIDISKPFPKLDTDLTANFFGQLAHQISCNLFDPLEYGMVNTPPILAEDMVAFSAIYWLLPHMDISIENLTDIIFNDMSTNLNHYDVIRSLLSTIRWYDPCIGNGVFPIAIILFLYRFGVEPKELLKTSIEGSDQNPIAVTATIIRVKLLLSNLTGVTYEQLEYYFLANFTVEDSLRKISEQSNTFTDTLFTSADIVIGNPPYVRAERIPSPVKIALKKMYPSVTDTQADLYNYFIAHGLLALKSKGILCYVSPASFQKSKYGVGTRKFIDQYGVLQVVFDFNELPVFSGVNVHSSVYLIGRENSSETVRSYTFNTLPNDKPLYWGLLNSVKIPSSNIGIMGWYLEKIDITTILDSLSKDSIPLHKYVGGIFSGIKTGHKQAYFLSQAQTEFLRKDDQSQNFIKPLILPVSIRTWKADWDGTHLALIKKGEIVSPDSLLMKHLKVFETELRHRSDIQGHPTWYGLRTCDYYDLFNRPKIIFPDIASECRFAIDTEGYLIPDGAFMLPIADYFILGLLNSCIGRFYFKVRCNSIGSSKYGGRLRFKKTYVKDFPIPLIDTENMIFHNKISQLVSSLVRGEAEDDAIMQLDELVLQLYNIPQNLWSNFLEN